jgi:hypothetical protein
MARIKYSALVSDMRNKLNGSVLSKNRAGSYIRNKVTPVNPQTAFQQTIRQRLGSFSTGWRGLTQDQRQAWLSSTKSFPYTDIFGDKKELDGKSLYVKLNMNLANAGQTAITDAPQPASIPVISLAVTTFEAEPSGVDLSLILAFTPASIPAGHSLMVYATDGVPEGITFIKNRYRFLGTGTVTTGTLNITALYEARFGASSARAGLSLGVRVALLNNTTGQMGVPVEVFAPIAAA